MNVHYATCATWRSGFLRECDCPPVNPWRITRLGFRRYEVARWLDGQWTRFMTASSRKAAIQLVSSLEWLTTEGLRRVG